MNANFKCATLSLHSAANGNRSEYEISCEQRVATAATTTDDNTGMGNPFFAVFTLAILSLTLSPGFVHCVTVQQNKHM